MNELYPLKFKPIFKEKIWGGKRIKNVLGMDYGKLPNCGEAWVLSGVDGFQSVASNGFLKGNELNELIEVYMGDLVGEKVYETFGDEFPLLLKIIDSDDWLSVQVHPDDNLARQRGFNNGKNEMWYVMDAGKNSEIITGFSTKLNQEDYKKHLQNKTLKSILNYEKVKQGDVFYTPAGRVHALGPEIMLAEIQQTSDVTYRIYDWDRMSADGQVREMHIEEALDAIDFTMQSEYKTKYRSEKNSTVNLINSKHFTTNILEFDSLLEKDYSMIDSFTILLCVDGKFAVKSNNIAELNAGEVLLIPNIIEKVELFPSCNSKLLEVFLR